ncbi:integrase core domain-containing protein [Salmonella enterica subsp. enterica serovar Weltevreden]|nr:integrase core domain-containing protein [Salmonella enterica subsp. enterica serovar Weltevreden]
MDFAPRKPTDNPFIESFNGSLRDECLNIHWFLSPEDAQENPTTGAGNTSMRERIHH